MGEAFSNRSICWSQLKQYQFSIYDAKAADSHGYCTTDTRREKTVNRILLCEQKLSNNKETKDIFTSLECTVNNDDIIFGHNNTIGRHIRAKRDIQCGEILIIEKAKVCCLNKTNWFFEFVNHFQAVYILYRIFKLSAVTNIVVFFHMKNFQYIFLT